MITPKRLPLNEFLSIYSKVVRLCVDLVIKNDKGVVFIKREIPPDLGKWHFPGGTVLRGEKIEETIKRVAKEETGLIIKIEKLLGLTEFIRQDENIHAVSIVYLCTPISGKLRGSFQGHDLRYFQQIPTNTIQEHEEFLLKNNIIG